VSDEGKSDDDSVGNVDDGIVSAPDAVVVLVVLRVALDGVSVVKSVVVDVVSSVGKVSVENTVVVIERQALSVEAGSKDNVDDASSDEEKTEDGKEESVSSSPSKESDQTQSKREERDEDREDSSQESRGTDKD